MLREECNVPLRTKDLTVEGLVINKRREKHIFIIPGLSRILLALQTQKRPGQGQGGSQNGVRIASRSLLPCTQGLPFNSGTARHSPPQFAFVLCVHHSVMLRL